MIKLLDGVEATGAGSVALIELSDKHTIQAVFSNSGGSVTALALNIEGSLDGIDFFVLASYTFSSDDLTAEGAMFHVVNKPVRYVRANITTLTETGTTAVTVYYAAMV